MAKVKKPAFAFIILLLLAFSSLGANVVGATDKRNMAFPSIGRTVILGVVGSAVLDRALQYSGATSLPAPAP